MPHLTLSGLVKTYGAARALDNAALDIRGGEVHALMGENGAGKSTLIRILAGLEQADAGQITLDGAPLALSSPPQAAAAGLRFLHQEHHIVPGLSVAENMHLSRPYPARLGLIRWQALRAAAGETMGQLGISHIDPAAPIAALGPGDQMLVRIAGTLIAGAGPAPWLYVLDEPTAALTGAEAERLFAVIARLRDAGAAILYVSHRIGEVLRICQRITVLRDGAHVSTHAVADTDQGKIIHDMTGRAFDDLYPPRVTPAGAAVVLSVQNLCAGPVAGLSFEVNAGEILGLAGLSGSGRNATLKALIGAIPRRAGRVMLGDVPLGARPADVWAQGVAYVPRERRSEGLMLLRGLGETVTLPHLSGLSRAGLVDRRRERALVRRLGDEVRLKSRDPAQPCQELSGGNQQKVLFARALAGDPRVLLLDEPTRGVDVGAKFDIYTLIRALAARGVAVIVTSSDLPELIGLSDRIAVLNAGTLTGIHAAAGLSEAGLLARCYDNATKDG